MTDIKPIITPNLLFNYLEKHIDNFFGEKSKEIASIFNQVDLYDLDGNKMADSAEYNEECDMVLSSGDSILNADEQNNFMNLLKQKIPEMYSLLKNFFSGQNSKSNEQILADNIANIGDNPKLLRQSLENLSNENLTEVAKIFNHNNIDSLFCTLYDDAQMCEYDEEVITQTVVEKFNDYAKYMLKNAKENNIYVKDYEKELQTYFDQGDYENYVLAMDNLQARIIMETDYDKNVDASKRKLELKEPNGKIDENFVQGYSGNCWFLSAIKSICGNEKLLDKLNNMISVEKQNGVITALKINIQGNEYKIDYGELKAANEYSSGDLDVRALEIAVNRYMHENHLDDINRSNTPENAYKFLFGEENVEYQNYDDSDEYINKMRDNNTNILSNLCSGNSKGYAYDKAGNKVQITKNHAFTYSSMNAEFLYFKDPHGKELHIPVNELSNSFDNFAIIKINI